jgi:tRNA (mo5U34)-methyltransferase
VKSWYHRIELAPGVVTPGVNDSQGALAQLELPGDMTGQRVLDIGASDGFFSFECERRGAEVLAIDYMPPEATGFAVARRLLGSLVEHRLENVYNLHPDRHGEFDLVLFLGVLYHLRNPLLALDRIWTVCRSDLVVETALLDNAAVTPDGFRSLGELAPGAWRLPLAQMLPRGELNGDRTNWWVPNSAALRGLLDAACFDVEWLRINGQRGVARARRSSDHERSYWRDLDGSGRARLEIVP